jgi:very-short-patch-repair endonuclease
VVTRRQLLDLGLGPDSIKHRVSKGRLYPLWRGVYGVGRPELGQKGRWMAAVLSCGSGASLSHRSAAALWGLLKPPKGIDIVVPRGTRRRRPGITVHRRTDLRPGHRRQIDGIPVMGPISTLVDLASCIPDGQLERAINEADRLNLVDPETLRVAIESLPRRPGLARLRGLLDRKALVDTGLERRFLRLIQPLDLPTPHTQAWVNGFRVDFYWPHLGLVVETDGFRYHRTPSQQASDRRRDQTHAAAGLATLRFAEEQIRYEPENVRATLAAVAERLSRVGLRPESRRL